MQAFWKIGMLQNMTEGIFLRWKEPGRLFQVLVHMQLHIIYVIITIYYD